MSREKAIEVLQSHKEHWVRLTYEKICDRSEGIDFINAVAIAINAIRTLEEIRNICDTAETSIEEEYGVVIVEGYYDVFELIKKKVRIPTE